MLRFSEIVLGTGGMRCSRCHDVTTETFRDVDAIRDDIERASRGGDAGRGPNFALVGAEPFRHPAIAEILESAVAAGAQRIRADSDAAALRSPETASSSLSSGIRHLRFTLLGSNSALHDALVGAAGSLEATAEGVRTFARMATKRAVPVHVSAQVPVCQHNVKDLPAIVDAAFRTGARHVLLTVADTSLDLRSASPWLEAACDTGVVLATWIEVEGMPDELASGWELHLAWPNRSSGELGQHG